MKLQPRRAVARALTIAIACSLAVPLASCAQIVALEPAADAASPACAAVSVRLPSAIGDLPGRETNAQATGAWGEPTSVILHCGVPAPPPTSELLCVTPPGGAVDWLMDDSDAPTYVFTSYGRTPAVSVAVDNTVVSGVNVLDALDVAVSQLPQDGSCLG
ncbi:MAG TPA: DUF3515 family protein [Microbacteriaceae bacterium]|nr:DUF3515 family protein [Microbacteriaceae bacterium]